MENTSPPSPLSPQDEHIVAALTFQGKDFHYILIGRWVERYTQRTAAS